MYLIYIKRTNMHEASYCLICKGSWEKDYSYIAIEQGIKPKMFGSYKVLFPTKIIAKIIAQRQLSRLSKTFVYYTCCEAKIIKIAAKR